MTTTVISVKVDEDVKKNAQAIAKSTGISLSSLINSYLIQVVATRRIELFAPEQMTPKLEKLIEQVEQEITIGEVSKAHTSADSFMKELLS
jgi:addiction module RelB/DinJ family antitoxin